MTDDDTVTVPMSNAETGEVFFRAELPRPVAEYVKRALRETGTDAGAFWMAAVRKYGDRVGCELNREQCPRGSDRQNRFVTKVFERHASDVLDAPPETPVGRAARFTNGRDC